MTTIYTWNEPDALTALDLSTADKLFVYDNSAGKTKVATFYDVQQQAQSNSVSTSSNGATIAGSVSGIVNLGTSTAVILSAATRAGVWRQFTSGTSTIAYTVTASGSSFGGGTVFTGIGGAVRFEAVSTSIWAPVAHLAAGATQLA